LKNGLRACLYYISTYYAIVVFGHIFFNGNKSKILSAIFFSLVLFSSNWWFKSITPFFFWAVTAVISVAHYNIWLFSILKEYSFAMPMTSWGNDLLLASSKALFILFFLYSAIAKSKGCLILDVNRSKISYVFEYTDFFFLYYSIIDTNSLRLLLIVFNMTIWK